jgi:hypothetical protein
MFDCEEVKAVTEKRRQIEEEKGGGREESALAQRQDEGDSTL